MEPRDPADRAGPDAGLRRPDPGTGPGRGRRTSSKPGGSRSGSTRGCRPSSRPRSRPTSRSRPPTRPAGSPSGRTTSTPSSPSRPRPGPPEARQQLDGHRHRVGDGVDRERRPPCCRRSTILGNKQTFLPISLTTASIPLYTGGRLLKTVDSARHSLQAQRTEEVRTAIDLKLTVAEAYVGVLRAKRNLDTARSNVEQLASFARDVRNRLAQGWRSGATTSPRRSRWPTPRSARSRPGRPSSRPGRRTIATSAGRSTSSPSSRRSPQLPTDDEFWERMAAQAVANRGEFAGKDDAEARDLTVRAFRAPPRAGRPGRAGPVAQRPGRRDPGEPPAPGLAQRRLHLPGRRELHPPGQRLPHLHRRLDVHRLGPDPPPGRVAQRPGARRPEAQGRPRRRRRPPGPDPLARPPAGQAAGAGRPVRGDPVRGERQGRHRPLPPAARDRTPRSSTPRPGGSPR